jgi:hypothetical protein
LPHFSVDKAWFNKSWLNSIHLKPTFTDTHLWFPAWRLGHSSSRRFSGPAR